MLPIHQIPWVNYPGSFLVKETLGVLTGQSKFVFGWVWTQDLRIKSTDVLPTELRGQYGSKSAGNWDSESR